jgi:hypothetical protein
MHNWYLWFRSIKKVLQVLIKKKKKDQGYKSDKIDTYTLQVYQFDTSIHLLAENLTEILSSV